MPSPAQAVRTLLSCLCCLCRSHLFVPWVIQELINSCLQCTWKIIKGNVRQKKQFYFYSGLLAELVSYHCAGASVPFVLSTTLQLSSRVRTASAGPMLSHSSSLANEIHLCSLRAAVTAPNTSWQCWFDSFFFFSLLQTAKKCKQRFYFSHSLKECSEENELVQLVTSMVCL